MSGTRMNFDGKNFFNGIDKAIDHFSNTEVLMVACGEALVTSTKDRFKEAVEPDGTPWKESARVAGKGGQILVENANLRNSIGYESTSDTTAVGSSVIYANVHQGNEDGSDIVIETRYAKITMPARPYLGFSDDDVDEMKEMYEEFLKQGFGL